MTRRYLQGRFVPTNPGKYIGDINNIIYRSSWELKFLRYCDSNSNVINYSSEEIVVPYYSRADQKMRRYFVDFAIKIRKPDGAIESFLVEIKPAAQTIKPMAKQGKKAGRLMEETYTWMVNQDKWEAANEYAEKRGAKFIILDEHDLGIK